MRAIEIWRTTVPGHTAHALLADPSSKSLFVGDGWGVAYGALRLRRFDPETGAELAEIRSRGQQVSSLCTSGDHLFAATSSRLLQLSPEDLSLVGQWEKVLPSDAQQLVAAGEWLVAANWRKPTIGLFRPATGETRRLRVGLQPLVVRHDGAVRIIDGFDGGARQLDLERGRLLGVEATAPVVAACAGADIWAVAAGEPGSGQGGAAWMKRGTNRILRLTGEGAADWEAGLVERAQAVACDDRRGLVWCIAGEGRDQLVALEQETGAVAASFVSGAGRSWAYVDPAADLAVASEPEGSTAGYRASSSASTLVGYALGD